MTEQQRTASAPPQRRMSREARREQILDAATHVFAQGGYAGTSTDQVARAAGVSQPYVVRMFGTKHELFGAALDRIGNRIVETFAAVDAGPEAEAEMSHAYARLLTDRDLLLVMMHGFAAGADPAFGSQARRLLTEVFEIFQDRTGATEREANNFVAQGVLLNVLLSVNAPEHAREDPRLGRLVECAFGEVLDDVVSSEVAAARPPLIPASRTASTKDTQ